MAYVVVFVQLRVWFIPPFLESALCSLRRHPFVTESSKVQECGQSISHHHGSPEEAHMDLTEKLVPLSLFDKDLPLKRGALLAARIGQQTL